MTNPDAVEEEFGSETEVSSNFASQGKVSTLCRCWEIMKQLSSYFNDCMFTNVNERVDDSKRFWNYPLSIRWEKIDSWASSMNYSNLRCR